MKFFGIVLFLPLSCLIAQIDSSSQLIVSVSPGVDSTCGFLCTFDKVDTVWYITSTPWSVMYGDSGLAWGEGLHQTPVGERIKMEGDKRAPAGIFDLGDLYGYPAEPPVLIKYPYHQINKPLRCVDDIDSKYYNRVVDSSRVLNDWKSAEHLQLTSNDYKYLVIVRHNQRSIPGRGSCIFLHINNGKSVTTSGCTAMDEENMLHLLQWLDPAKHPLLVQLTVEQYRTYQSTWKLPILPLCDIPCPN